MKRGFTLLEIMIVVGVVALLTTIAVQNLIRSNLQANESATQAALRTISTAEFTYRSDNTSYGNLTQLGSPTRGPVYIDKVLGCGTPPCVKNGYNFNTTDVAAGIFSVNATPVKANVTGVRSFCVTEDGVVRVQATGGTIADHTACLALPNTK